MQPPSARLLPFQAFGASQVMLFSRARKMCGHMRVPESVVTRLGSTLGFVAVIVSLGAILGGMPLT